MKIKHIVGIGTCVSAVLLLLGYAMYQEHRKSEVKKALQFFAKEFQVSPQAIIEYYGYKGRDGEQRLLENYHKIQKELNQ